VRLIKGRGGKFNVQDKCESVFVALFGEQKYCKILP